MSECRFCPAEIRWARTERGKSIPLDAEPNPEGNVVLSAEGIASVYASPSEALRASSTVYMPHHATCAGADRARAIARRRRKGRQ